jgi:hypothetical protein
MPAVWCATIATLISSRSRAGAHQELGLTAGDTIARDNVARDNVARDNVARSHIERSAAAEPRLYRGQIGLFLEGRYGRPVPRELCANGFRPRRIVSERHGK